jgi:hypothetical protein
MADIGPRGEATMKCACGHAVVVVDRYATDSPPGPRGKPERWIEFYAQTGGDPDDLLWECPACDVELELAELQPIDDWPRVQNELRAGVYGEWPEIRDQIAVYFAALAPGEGLGSSDVNHIAYEWVKSGRLTRAASQTVSI